MNKYMQIPPELRSQDAWVGVMNGSKIPYMLEFRGAASTTNPDTWSTFKDAMVSMELGITDGIGYVFHNTGIVGIDIDCGYDEYGALTKEAKAIIEACGSYTERSRSGRGFHILIKGKLPFKGKNNLRGIEIYQDARYFIMTGNVVQPELRENQAAIDWVLKTFFADCLRQSEGKHEPRIYNPEWQKPCEGRISVRPQYPRIPNGSRNVCLASLAGMLHGLGYRQEVIFSELCYANDTACDPKLSHDEIEQIVMSITKYKR